MKKFLCFELFILFTIIGFLVGNSFAGEVSVFGPKKYLRTSGSPNNYSDNFIAVSGQGKLVVKNGAWNGTKRIIDAVSSASVYVNGERIFGPRDFNKNTYLLEQNIPLNTDNSISVELASSPGSYITIEIIQDIAPPDVSLNAVPSSLFFGQSSLLTWASNTAETCMIEPGIGEVALNGSVAVFPSKTTTYTITATGLGGATTAHISVIVKNSPPIANSQSISTNEDNELSITLGGSDIDNDPLTYEILNSPSSGSLSGTAPNLIYTPDENFNGEDSFTFKINDGQIDSEPATISIIVNPINDPPAANAGSDQQVTRTSTVVLDGTGSNDIDGDTLFYQWSFVSKPAGSIAAFSDPSSVNPFFVADISGRYELELIVNDGIENSAPDTVSITVSPRMLTVPSVINLSQSDAESAITATGLVVGTITTANSDSVPLNAVISQSPEGGGLITEGSTIILTVSIGPVSLKPQVNLTASPAMINQGELSTLTWSSTNGDTAFIEPGIGAVALNGSIEVSPTETTTYIITASGYGDTVTARVVVTVANSAPTAGDQSLTTNEDVSMPVTLTGSDPDNDALSYEIITGPTAGTLSGTTPNLTYTPNANYNGEDSFTFKTNDGQADSAPATITLTIQAVNDAPVANAGVDQGISRTDTAVLDGSGSNDIDGDTLTYQWSFISMPSGSSSVLSNSTAVNPVFVADVSGTYELELIVNDGTVASSSDTVTIIASPQMVAVPSLINLPQPDAEVAITSASLVLGTITTANSNTVPLNAVISQSPERGTTVVEGSAIDLVVSLGSASAGTGPQVTLSASPTTINQGELSTLTWSSVNGSTAFIEPYIGNVAVNDSVIIAPDYTTTYTITVTGSEGSASNSVVVSVLGEPEIQPKGSFGEQYNYLIPSNSTVESYDPKRFSLITGQVQDIFNNPLEDVSVTIFNHPEYGTANTDATGRFSIPVEGGGNLHISYQKEEHLTVHRQVDVPWNDIAVAETIAMIAQDSAATTFTFDGNPNTITTHQSTPIIDESGSRSATMVFTGDNHAYLVDVDGNDVHELTTITTRATEFVIPESMPAKLPPNSAFTYCTELSVDGAQRVRFEKPVITWVDNFLGFDVGEIVPVGYYDRDLGAWVPSDNGIVVRLLDTDNDGKVDALDATGDNIPDDLNNNGSFSDEVMGLNDPNKYQPNATFWRVAIAHFTPWDFNWPYAPPLDAIPPNPKGLPTIDEKKEEQKDCKANTGSFVEERSRIFNEDIAIPGTDMTLHYASNRVEGYKNIIRIPVSGDSVPQSLKRIIVRLTVAGQTYEQVLDALPNQAVEFIWNGLDRFGKSIGTARARVSIGFEYDLFYTRANNLFARAFAQPGTNITNVRGRMDMISWENRDIWVSVDRSIQGKNSIADGWSLSAHHNFVPWEPSTLYKGNGSFLKNRLTVIETVAGSGSYSHAGDGGMAIEAGLYDPSNVIPDATGGYYIMEYWDHFIRYVDADGKITTIAGTGIEGYNGDGLPAITAQLNHSFDAAVDDAGNLYITDTYNQRIRKIGIDGIITTVAGTGTSGYTGDGGPAIQAQLSYPFGIDLDNEGNIYFADRYNHVIRKIDSGGIITTIGGNGNRGDGGDGGVATQAQLGYPWNVIVDDNGDLYIAQDVPSKIRKIGVDGIITTVAGTGTQGYTGDGGPAISAELASPTGLAIDKSGNLYIADTYNYRIRKVDPNGIISTIAGTGEYGFAGDGDIPTRALMSEVYGIAVDPAGNLLIADSYYDRIRKIESANVKIALIALNELIFPEGNGLGHIMDNAGLHQKTIDLDTRIILREFMYNEDNQLISIVDQFNNQTLINRDENGKPISITSPDGFTTQLTIGANNHLDDIIYPDGSDYHFVYSTDGLLESKTEPKGNRFEHIFDANGRLTDATDDEGGHWQFDRSVLENGDILTAVLTGEGNLSTYNDHTDSTGAYTSTITDPTGSQSIFTESSDGLLSDKSLSCGMNLSIRYDLDSEYKFKFAKELWETTPSSIERHTVRNNIYQDTDNNGQPDLISNTVSVNGKISTLENNVLLSQKSVISPEGRIVTSLYNPLTLATDSIQVPGLLDQTYGYDTKGRLTSAKTGSREMIYTYNNSGFLESITDPGRQTTTFTHDPLGRIVTSTRPDQSVVGFNYDTNGNMTMLINPASIDHVFTTNAVNMKDSYQLPLSGIYSYQYDRDRRLISTIFPSGKQISNVYDTSQLIQTQTPEGNIDYTYSCALKLDSVSKNGESINYTYDGNLVKSIASTGTLNQGIELDYNNDFNTTSIKYAGVTENITYDNDGLITGVGNYTITNNAQNGLPESVTGGSLQVDRTFNGYAEVENQTVTIGGQAASSWNLTRDDNGRILSKTENLNGTVENFVYGYDSMGRLHTVSKDGTLVEEYIYNATGTRQYEMNTPKGIAGRTMVYSDEDHLLSAANTNYNYDVDGFLTTKTQGSDISLYNYSSRGELLSVTLPNGTFIEYSHDPLGRRIAKKVNGQVTEKYLWNGLTQLLAVYDGADNLFQRFEYADDRMPVSMSQNGIHYYFTFDQVGSLRLVTDSAGNVTKRIDRDTFGYVISDSNPNFAVPFGFAGGLYDADTGLVRFGYRDYDPDTGRWTAKDPIGFSGGDTDLYGYVLNDPVNFVDPTGEVGILGAVGIGATVGGLASFTGTLIGGGSLNDAFASVPIGMLGGAAAVVGAAGAMVTGATSTAGLGIGAVLDLGIHAITVATILNESPKETSTPCK